MSPPGHKPEERARRNIDARLTESGWLVQDYEVRNIQAGPGVAVREFPLVGGHGTADYLLFVDGRPAGVVEAKAVGHTLSGVEVQTDKYATGLPKSLSPVVRPLPFLYQSTGVETRFTNGLDPTPCSRAVFAFHRPETLSEWLAATPLTVWARGAVPANAVGEGGLPFGAAGRPSTFRSRLLALPPIAPAEAARFWGAQKAAIEAIETSMRANRPRALLRMATGSGKTFTTVSLLARLLHFAGPRRVLFLVDRTNLGDQAATEFERYRVPWTGRFFPEEWGVEHLASNHIGDSTKVVITTIQRLYSMLRGEAEAPPEPEEGQADRGISPAQIVPVEYGAALPPEFFDLIVVDECHRSIYSTWGQVLSYFDAFLVGLTATPSKNTYGFFEGNVVYEYGHEQAVADGVNVDFEVFRIRTRIGEHGGTIAADGETVVKFRDRATREMRWAIADEDIAYGADALDRDVVAVDRLRTIFCTFREKLFTDLFPGRTEVPKTLVFCKDDGHAEDVVKAIREAFEEGNDFCRKITYKTTGETPKELLQKFRTQFNPRIAVTVDMVATGTDIKPVEIVVFLRKVKSRIFFEQMKGRGVRVCDATEMRSVSADAKGPKDHFVVVDCVGLTEQDFQDTQPLERRKAVPLAQLIDAVASGSTDADVLTSLASRLVRLDRKCGDAERRQVAEVGGGTSLSDLTHRILEALDPDARRERARTAAGLARGQAPSAEQVSKTGEAMVREAVRPLVERPALRKTIDDLRRHFEQVIDEVTRDEVVEADFSEEGRRKAADLVQSFERYLAEHRDEHEALKFFYARPAGSRLRYADVRRLHDALGLADARFVETRIWEAYARRDGPRVRGAGQARALADLVALVRYATKAEPALSPYAETVRARFDAWMERRRKAGRAFTDEQRLWLERIRDHVAASVEFTLEDFEVTPFVEQGGAARARRLFGADLPKVVAELNEALVA
ncbi:MAG: DEAD/DEAH box helicase family protein [Planctomycetes bacterium]|nr:DEAD/DEAH box helicase family protein [Planctomycetota bacterium]